MTIFKSTFSIKLSDYLQLRRGLGFKSETEEFLLKDFDTYLTKKGYVGPLSQELAVAFATQNSDWSINYREARYRTVRHFSSYLSTIDPAAPLLNPKALPVTRVRRRAHIFSEEEMKTLLAKAISLSPLMRGKVIHAMIGLGASSGLRISEVVRLDKSDVNLEIGILTIRNSKFGKSRMVPIHSSVVKVLTNYATARDESFAKLDSYSFFVNVAGKRFTRNNLQVIFSKLAHAAGLRNSTGRGPSFHCLRHTFAVKRLVEWFQAGTDVQVMLPALATYMGHVHYTESSYYLQGTPELLDVATKNFHNLFVSKESIQ
jgi:integrase